MRNFRWSQHITGKILRKERNQQTILSKYFLSGVIVHYKWTFPWANVPAIQNKCERPKRTLRQKTILSREIFRFNYFECTRERMLEDNLQSTKSKHGSKAKVKIVIDFSHHKAISGVIPSIKDVSSAQEM